eukprot:scaffold6866_cov118-Isochrysis_galbana.AAC.9
MAVLYIGGPCCPVPVPSAVAAPASRQKRGCRGCPPRRRRRGRAPRSAPAVHFGRPCVQPPAPHTCE